MIIDSSFANMLESCFLILDRNPMSKFDCYNKLLSLSLSLSLSLTQFISEPLLELVAF